MAAHFVGLEATQDAAPDLEHGAGATQRHAQVVAGLLVVLCGQNAGLDLSEAGVERPQLVDEEGAGSDACGSELGRPVHRV